MLEETLEAEDAKEALDTSGSSPRRARLPARELARLLDLRLPPEAATPRGPAGRGLSRPSVSVLCSLSISSARLFAETCGTMRMVI